MIYLYIICPKCQGFLLQGGIHLSGYLAFFLHPPPPPPTPEYLEPVLSYDRTAVSYVRARTATTTRTTAACRRRVYGGRSRRELRAGCRGQRGWSGRRSVRTRVRNSDTRRARNIKKGSRGTKASSETSTKFPRNSRRKKTKRKINLK